jgi:hypothetical protein
MEQHTIALAGMSNEQIDAFRTALKICAATGWTLVDGVQADLVVVDGDGSDEPLRRLRAERAPARRIAVFTDRADPVDHDFVLKKPLYSNKLKSLLDCVDELLAHAGTDASVPPQSLPAGPSEAQGATSATVDPPTAARAEAAPGDEIHDRHEERSTVGAHLLAGDVDGPLRVELGSFELLLDPDHDCYHAATAIKPLQALLELPLESAQPLDAEAVEQMRGTPALPMMRLRWFAALCGMPGPSTAMVDPQAAYRLARWPQIEREFPQHFRMAKAMLKHAGTPHEIAAAAGTAVEDVVAFVRAYRVTGHVTVASPASGPGTGPAVHHTPSKWRQTLARTLRPATGDPQARATSRRPLDLPMFG